MVIGSMRNKLISVLRTCGSSPAERFIQNQNAFLPACIKKRRVGYLTETTRVTSCALAARVVSRKCVL